jgi:Metal-dependent hydrolases of the beta-lactamase superfamily I
MRLKFLSLASGSSGNCYFLGTDDYGILLDAGISIRSIKKILRDNRIELEQIMGVFVTHDHADHIKSVGCLGEKFNIPIYTTELIHRGIEASRYVENKLSSSKRVIEVEKITTVRDFRIIPFLVPHDSTECVGYCIEFRNQKFVLATDIGHINDNIVRYAKSANHLIIEANYDREMLSHGNYPAFLKERIMKGTGHLSNAETAAFLASIFDLHLKNIYLCHLSRDNNHPELACKTVEMAMRQYGIRPGKDVNLTALKRMHPSEMYIFDE